MNKEYILNKVKPFVNDNGMIKEVEFNNLFNKLDKHHQYEVINILIEANVDIDYENYKFNGDYKNRSNKNINSTQYRRTASIGISKVDKLTNEQLCVLYQRGNESLMEIIIKKNNKLVWSRVFKIGKMYNHKLDNEDLYQCGVIGLMTAVKKFDLSKNAKFSTYSTWWIDQQIYRNIVDTGFTVRIPAHYFEQAAKLMKIISRNSECTKQQLCSIANDNGIDANKFEELLMIVENLMSLTSLNVFIGEEGDSELGDYIINDSIPSVEEQVEYTILKETIDEVLNTLKEKQKNIIEQRFGLIDGKEKTLEQVGTIYNLTRERIRQIEAKAIRKLRHPSRSKKLKNFI